MKQPDHDENVDELFVMLKTDRKRLGLSLEQVATGVGTTHSVVRSWEELQSCPSFRNLVKWVKFLGYKIEIYKDV